MQPVQPAHATCGICLQVMNISRDGGLAALPCGHVFCQICIDARFAEQERRTCPECDMAVEPGDVIPLFINGPPAIGRGLSDEECRHILEAWFKASRRVTKTRRAYIKSLESYNKIHKKYTKLDARIAHLREAKQRANNVFQEAYQTWSVASMIPGRDLVADPGVQFDDMPALDGDAVLDALVNERDTWDAMIGAEDAYKHVEPKFQKVSEAFREAQVNLLGHYQDYYKAMADQRDAREAVTRL